MFREVTHDENESIRYRRAALFMGRLRKYAGKLDREHYDSIRKLALDGDFDGAEDELTLAMTGAERVKPSPFPIKIGRRRR